MNNRPLLMAVICFVLGELGEMLTFSTAVIITLAGVALIVISYIRENGASVLLLLLLAFYVFGYIRCAYALNPDIVMLSGAGEINADVIGQVSVIEEGSGGFSIYLSHPEVIVENGAGYKLNRRVIIKTDECNVRLGQMIHADGILASPKKARNPGEFNAFYYYRARNVDSILTKANITVVAESYYPVRDYLLRLRHNMVLRCRAMLLAEDAGLIEAMVMGYRADIDESVKELYKGAGISHIIAISGLHIGFIGVLIYGFLRKIKLPIFVAAVISGVMIVLYATFTGMSGSSFRAMVMLLVAFTARIIGRSYDMLSAMSLAAIIILVLQPLQIVDCGFLLSFGAIVGIAAVYPAVKCCNPLKKRLPKRVVDSLIVSVSIQIVTFPILVEFYYEVPTYSIVIGLVVIPLMSLLVPSAILGILLTYVDVYASNISFIPAELILKTNKALCLINEQMPASHIVVGKLTASTVILYYSVLAVIIFLLYQRNEIKRRLIRFEDIKRCQDLYKEYKKRMKMLRRIAKCVIACVVALTIAFAAVRSAKTSSQMLIDVLDVGQGDGIVLRMPDKRVVLIDGGSSSNSGLYKYTYSPYLKSQRITGIYAVIISHSDTDHISAIKELIADDYPIGYLMLPDAIVDDDNYTELCKLAAEHNVSVKKLSRGMCITLGKCKLNVLHPPKHYISDDVNNTSTNIYMEFGDFTMLFTGDIGGEGEEELVRYLKHSVLGDKRANVLKVAHHGSRFSSSDEFLDVIRPKDAIISVSATNRYGHPSKDTLFRLKSVGADIYCTKDTGMVEIKTDGKGYNISSYID